LSLILRSSTGRSNYNAAFAYLDEKPPFSRRSGLADPETALQGK
jgi:hypothetical protein